jgi:hypothetical protein
MIALILSWRLSWLGRIEKKITLKIMRNNIVPIPHNSHLTFPERKK